MCKKIWFKSIFIFFSGFTPLAHATIPGFYILGQVGSGNTHIQASDVPALSMDAKVVLTGRVAGGYQFNQNLALEVGYTRFSDIKFAGVGGVADQNAKLSETALDFMAKPLLSLSNNFAIYAKIGLAYVKAKGTGNVNGKPYLGYSDNWQPAFGLGFSYDLTPNVLIDLAAARFQSLGKNNVMPSADFYSVGIAYYFG